MTWSFQRNGSQRTGQRSALTGEFEFGVARGAQASALAGALRQWRCVFGGVFMAVHKVFGAFEQCGGHFDADLQSPKRLIT
jgi:hypothetical protein